VDVAGEPGSNVEIIEISGACESITGSSLVGLRSVTISEGNMNFSLEDEAESTKPADASYSDNIDK
jgi:hypothetical protein